MHQTRFNAHKLALIKSDVKYHQIIVIGHRINVILTQVNKLH